MQSQKICPACFCRGAHRDVPCTAGDAAVDYDDKQYSLRYDIARTVFVHDLRCRKGGKEGGPGWPILILLFFGKRSDQPGAHHLLEGFFLRKKENWSPPQTKFPGTKVAGHARACTNVRHSRQLSFFSEEKKTFRHLARRAKSASGGQAELFSPMLRSPDEPYGFEIGRAHV